MVPHWYVHVYLVPPIIPGTGTRVPWYCQWYGILVPWYSSTMAIDGIAIPWYSSTTRVPWCTIGTMVHVYTYHGTRVHGVRTMVPWYGNTTMVEYHWYLVLEYQWYHGTKLVRTRVPLVLEYHGIAIPVCHIANIDSIDNIQYGIMAIAHRVPWLMYQWYHGTYTCTYVRTMVRVQAHMLARIVVEIRAADIAVEL